MLLIYGLVVILNLISFRDCANYTQQVLFNYREKVTLECLQNSTNVSFYSIDKDGKYSKIQPDPLKYVFNETTLTILNIVKHDSLSRYSCITESNDIVNYTVLVPPRLYEVDSLSLTVIEGYTANISCHLLLGNEANQTVNWTWIINNRTVISPSDKYIIDSSLNTSSTLSIVNSAILDTNVYFCAAINDYGIHYRNTTLRIKSKLAPLWPFFGVLIEAVILAFILLQYEKKIFTRIFGKYQSGGDETSSKKNEKEN